MAILLRKLKDNKFYDLNGKEIALIGDATPPKNPILVKSTYTFNGFDIYLLEDGKIICKQSHTNKFNQLTTNNKVIDLTIDNKCFIFITFENGIKYKLLLVDLDENVSDIIPNDVVDLCTINGKNLYLDKFGNVYITGKWSANFIKSVDLDSRYDPSGPDVVIMFLLKVKSLNNIASIDMNDKEIIAIDSNMNKIILVY